MRAGSCPERVVGRHGGVKRVRVLQAAAAAAGVHNRVKRVSVSGVDHASL